MSIHPFDPLTPAEITTAASIVRSDLQGCGDIKFRVITLKEPPKTEMLRFLTQVDSGHTAVSRPARIAHVQVIQRDEKRKNHLVELLVDLGKAKVVDKQYLPGKHSYIDSDYMKAVEAACGADPRVQTEVRSLDLPKEATVVIEAWAYAPDGMNDMSERVTMCWFYMRMSSNPDANYYAYPLDVCAEVSEDLKVTRVYRLPSANPESDNQNKTFDRRKIHENSEYHPDLRPPPRNTTKPYQVHQPEGPSFETRGNFLTWEKWTMHIGFNYREGMTLHDVRYDGRSLFYRLSLAEMFVPYGDPRSPYPRKAAFDLGNDGAGINANNLVLGCDCLGYIKYFDGWHTTGSGMPLKMPNVICCHEQDDGILWKHTNFRTKNAVVARSRILVLQTVITVSNYEYIFAFHFGQDASINYEVRATGIVSTSPIEPGKQVPFGTVVAPGVLAAYHQHLFSLRIDPILDGVNNSLEIEESVPMPIDDPNVHNPFGVGYTTTSRIVENEGPLDLDFTKNRTFKIINENKINPVTGTPVGWKLYPCYSQMLLSHPQSFHARRSEYGSHAVWVTRHNDEELYPSGKFTMQSLTGDGIATAIKRRQADPLADTSVRNQDIVIWHTFGATHNPRIEDWPIMPKEVMSVGLKPVNFFSGNPGVDVAPSTQEKNKSVLVQDSANESASGCCKPRL